MSSLALDRDRPVTTAQRATPAPIPFGRIVRMEMRKSFDTRAGRWLLASIVIASVLATAAVVLWAPDSAQTYETFASAIGMPMTVILPIIGILSVTSEWSQRTGLTTFTLVPRRGRSIRAKAVVALVVAVVSMLIAMGIGAVGTLVGSGLRGLDPVWGIDIASMGNIILAQVLSMAVGFMFGVLLRSSAAAIVGYFVYGFVLGNLTALLAATQDWFRDLQPWVDFNAMQMRLYDESMSALEWTQLGVTGLIWVVLPTAFGLWSLMRSEIS